MTWSARHTAAAALSVWVTMGCAKGRQRVAGAPVPLTEPTVLCNASNRDRPCRTAAEVESLLARPDLEVLDSSPTPGGLQDARAKWAESSSGIVNEPRRELAAHGLQRLLFDERLGR